jgi:hypothetical protein
MLTDRLTNTVSTEPATDVPKVSQETTMIQKLLAEHKEIASNMEQRLHAVLRPVGPSASGSGSQEPTSQVRSPLVSDLAQFREVLSDIANHYLGILNRLEV